MTNYCTLFDKNYLVFGLALHQSLLKNNGEFTLYILAMDKECEKILKELNLRSVIIITLDSVIDENYLFVYEQMSFAQICWTCQPLLCKYILNHFMVPSITYLEADSYFFDNPEKLIQQIGEHSVSLVPHRYSKGHDQSKIAGIYCVQFNFFRNNGQARVMLQDWEASCLMYDKNNRRYLPGQLCLDTWPTRFDGVKIIEDIGAGAAPWNLAAYDVRKFDGNPYVDKSRINFYHFHELAFYRENQVYISSYDISSDAMEIIYRPYIQVLVSLKELLMLRFPDFNHFKSLALPTLLSSIKTCNWSVTRLYLRYAYLRATQRFSKNCVILSNI